MNPPLNPVEAKAILARMCPDPTTVDTPAPPALADLIGLIAEGDEAALGRFYSLTLARVYGLALKITSRHDLAEDVCVETYWQCWREAARYDQLRGHPLAWLMTMTRSRALDALRRLDPAMQCPEPEIFLQNEPTTTLSPVEHLFQREDAASLHQAMAQLTPIQRQLLALSFYRDLSHQEISDHTDLPLGTVKSHLKRAQDSLRRVLCQE